MVFDLQVINSDATLNAFFDIGSARFIVGSPLDLVLRILQPNRDGLRFIIPSAYTAELSLVKSDPTAAPLVVVSTFPFSDDRSIIKFSMTAAEMADIIGQNLIVNIKDGGGDVVHTGFLKNGLQTVLTDDC